MHGLLNLPWWGYLLSLFILMQVTIISVTLYLHRSQTHRALDLHAIPSHFFRFWLWLSTGMITKEWVAIHRKHHAKVETEDDPHSPVNQGILTVLFQGTELYRKESRNLETLERYGEGTPSDWLERHVYHGHNKTGIVIMLLLDLLFFGSIGLSIWAIQMITIPFFAAGVINGVGHYWGYRNFECQDASRNVSPLAIFLAGEELHNNHHTYATSAKFSVKWWEFDLGWLIIRCLMALGLAKPKRLPPKLIASHDKKSVDIETVKAVLTNRFQLMARYSKDVMMPVFREERRLAGEKGAAMLKRIRSLLTREASLVDSHSKQDLSTVLSKHQSLHLVYDLRLKLQNIWAKSTATQKELVEALQDWCKQAEATGLEVLRSFVQQLKTYVPQC